MSGTMNFEERQRPRKTIVYLVTNLINGKKYVGITCGYLSQRRAKHFHTAEKRNSPTIFSKAIRKYGREMFSFREILVCENYAAACREEGRLIALWSPSYNQTGGGEGYLGYKPTPEAIEKTRRANTGRPGYWKNGPPPSTMAKLRARLAQPDMKEKWQEYRKLGPVAGAKAVVCLNDDKIFSSQREAQRHYGIPSKDISAICNRRFKSTRGLVFRFFGDHFRGKEELAETLNSPKSVAAYKMHTRRQTARTPNGTASA